MKSEAKTIPSCSLLSRRAVIAGTASITAGSMLPTAGLAALPTLTSPTEGVFLVFTDPGGGNPADSSGARVFFISSGWLELFEVTGVYEQQNLSAQDVANAIRGSSSARIKRFKALYADGLDPSHKLKGAIAGATIIPPVLTSAQARVIEIEPRYVDVSTAAMTGCRFLAPDDQF